MEPVTRNDLRDFFDDMKQYISAELDGRFAEQDARIEKRFAEQDARIDARFAEQDERLDEKLDEILNAVGEDLAKHTAKLDDHDERIKRLEHKAA